MGEWLCKLGEMQIVFNRLKTAKEEGRMKGVEEERNREVNKMKCCRSLKALGEDLSE